MCSLETTAEQRRRSLMRKRSAAVALGSVFAALVLAACQKRDPDPDYSQVCVDEQTGRRVDDDECDGGGSGRGWIFFPYSYPVPAVGAVVDRSHGSAVRPASGRIAPVARGGFGGRAAGGGS